MSIQIVTRPYFLGGEHRQVVVDGERRLSIIPQPSALGVHENLFEIARLEEGNLEVLGAYCTEKEIAEIVGQEALSGRL